MYHSCLDILLACFQETEFFAAKKIYYDLRYFSFKDDIAHSSCGIARYTIMTIYRTHRFEWTDFSTWSTAIWKSQNPVVEGFLAEQLCLLVIKRHGLLVVSDHAPAGLLEVEYFLDRPNWATIINKPDVNCCLYMPSVFNYPNVDAAILQLDRDKLEPKARLYLIQMTLARSHKDSEMLSYRDQWQEWVRPHIRRQRARK